MACGKGGHEEDAPQVACVPGGGDHTTTKLIKWQAVGTDSDFAHSAPPDASGNALGSFTQGQTGKIIVETSNGGGTRTTAPGTITLGAGAVGGTGTLRTLWEAERPVRLIAGEQLPTAPIVLVSVQAFSHFAPSAAGPGTCSPECKSNIFCSESNRTRTGETHGESAYLQADPPLPSTPRIEILRMHVLRFGLLPQGIVG